MSVLIARRQKSGIAEVQQNRVLEMTDELVALCPKCKTFETLWFTNDRLVKTRRFSQENSQVYHDCGANEPCRLFRAS